MPALLVLLPLAAALVAYAVPSERYRPWLLPLTAVLHSVLVVVAIASPGPLEPSFGGWLLLDDLGKVVLGVTSAIYLLCSFYAVGYLALRPERKNRVFSAALLAFLGMISLMVQAHHLGLMWVALESLTLTCAPLVYFHHNPRSLEATWKYLLIGSVGIALSLLGSFFLAYSALAADLAPSLLFEDLLKSAPHLSRPWLESAFILLFVGYGTKMGLAPMHTWKPDAYGEAPGLAGSLLAGCVTSCAFLAVLRFYQICLASGDGTFAREILIFTGLFSMLVGAAFMTRQRDYKRLLAYSSVEHMGILVLGVGIGGAAIFGALLHLVFNALAKGVMFLSAGNIHRAYGSKLTDEVTGAIQRVPLSAGLFFAGFLAVTGAPPFGPFFSELTILRGAIGGGQTVVAAAFLLLLAVAFLNMGTTVIAVVQGAPRDEAPLSDFRDRFLTVAPIFGFLALVLLLGLYLPPPLESLLHSAAAMIEQPALLVTAEARP